VGCGIAGRRLSTLTKKDHKSCRERAAARLARLTPFELVYRPEILFAVAHRPA
jgi:hypothetical protein